MNLLSNKNLVRGRTGESPKVMKHAIDIAKPKNRQEERMVRNALKRAKRKEKQR